MTMDFLEAKCPFDNDERRAFREAFRRFVERDIKPYVDDWDEAGFVPRELHKKAGELGLYGFGVDERYGGLGFDDVFMRSITSQELGQCGANGVGASLTASNIAITPIHMLATEEIKSSVLPQIMAGELGACLAITEPSGGSDVARMRTQAKRDGDDYVINGTKTFISGGMTGSYFVVGARTGGVGLDGISLFLVEAEMPGFDRTAIERKMGWWSSDTATLYFDDCRVPASNLIGEEGRGFAAIMNNFNIERIGLASNALGSSKLCLAESVAYAQERSTFGKPLIRHQVIRHKIADMSARVDLLEAYINQILWRLDQGELQVAEICKAKFMGSKTFEFCASEAMQIFGGAGYLRGNVVERMYREVKVNAIGGGSEEIMRDLAVRQMGL